MGNLVKALQKLGLLRLLKGWNQNSARSKQAARRIERGESPFNVLSEMNDVPMDPRSRAIRALKEGHGSTRYNEAIHGSYEGANIHSMRPGTHFGTPQQAMDRVYRNVHPYDRGNPARLPEQGAAYPVTLRDNRYAAETKDIITEGGTPPLSAFVKRSREMGHSPKETLMYENVAEEPGKMSFINMNRNVRGRFAAFNPHWRNFPDLLAAGLPLSMLMDLEEDD